MINFLAGKYAEWDLATPKPWAWRLIPRPIRSAMRLGLVKLCDPPVACQVHGVAIRFPLSHDLPFVLARLPEYGANLGRIARLLATKYPDLTIIDIGANVGDSVAILHAYVRRPVLCIEGLPAHLQLLHRNVAAIGADVEVAETFVGGEDATIDGAIVAGMGSARIVASGGQRVTMRTLRSVLAEHPRFARAKLLKIDTDGFDCEIIRSQAALLRELKPVIFFEYDPALFVDKQPDGFEVFRSLAEAGYSRLLFHDNEGDYLLSADVSNATVLTELDVYMRGRKGMAYWDITAFHVEDGELAVQAAGIELEHFRRVRGRG